MAITKAEQNCTDVDSLVQQYYLPLTYVIIFIGDLIGNVTSIAVYLTKIGPWKSSSIIMVNLALADLLYAFSLPFLVYYYINGGSWMLGDFMCRFVRLGFHLHLYGSILFLTCLAFFRYVVVMNPLRIAQVQEKRWGITACAAVWLIAAAEITPMLTVLTIERSDNKTYCPDFASSLHVDDVRLYSWFLFAFGFLLPLAVVSMCYVRIARKLSKGPNTTSPCRVRARRSTVMILVVFVMCFLPFHITRAARIESRKMNEPPCMMQHIVNAAYIISRPLAGLNTFFNLALYTYSGDMFKKAFHDTFCRKSWLTKAQSQVQLAVISNAVTEMPSQHDNCP